MFDGLLIENFHFIRPWWGLLILPIGALRLFFRKHQQHKKQQLSHSYLASHLLAALTVAAKRQGMYSPNYLMAVIGVVALLILMGPTWARQPSPFEEDKAALYIALDVSGSMNSRDIEPSRLRRAKQKIRDLLALRAGGETALIVYAGSAHAVLPLSNDPQILESYLASISTEMMPKTGKFPETILPLLNADTSIPVSVLLISDGIGSHSVAAFNHHFQHSAYQLLVLGIGLGADELEAKQLNGVAALDSNGLQALARAAGGSYIRATVNADDVQAIAKQLQRFMLASADYQAPWHDASYPLVFVLMLLVLPWFRKGWALSSLLLICLNPLAVAPVQAGGFSDLWFTPDQQGRHYFERGDYAQAAASFDNIQWKASAYYLAEEFDLAAEYFSRINSDTALFAQANALAHGERYLKALAIYSDILAERPNFKPARKNQGVVQDIVDAINLMASSQQASPDENFRVDDLDSAPDKADGADRRVIKNAEPERFTAEQLLNDKALNEQWLRSVQAKPARFLSAKFYLQLHQQSTANDGGAAP